MNTSKLMTAALILLSATLTFAKDTKEKPREHILVSDLKDKSFEFGFPIKVTLTPGKKDPETFNAHLEVTTDHSFSEDEYNRLPSERVEKLHTSSGKRSDGCNLSFKPDHSESSQATINAGAKGSKWKIQHLKHTPLDLENLSPAEKGARDTLTAFASIFYNMKKYEDTFELTNSSTGKKVMLSCRNYCAQSKLKKPNNECAEALPFPTQKVLSHLGITNLPVTIEKVEKAEEPVARKPDHRQVVIEAAQ